MIVRIRSLTAALALTIIIILVIAACDRVGRAPDDLVWELGLQDGKPTWVVGPGERILKS